MAKKNEENTVKTTEKAATKTTEKAATKASTKTTTKAATKAAAKTTQKEGTKKAAAKAKPDAKVTKITKAKADKKTPVAAETKQDTEKNNTITCQEMMTSIIEWTMDSLMYSNIMLISRKQNISMEEAAAILDVSAIDLAKLSLVYDAYSKIPDSEKTAVLGKYRDRIKTV